MGIWPSSKPFIDTPVRANWPLTPLPDVLPLPEPIPRPSRLDLGRAPGLSRSSFSFISGQLLDLEQVGHLVDHPAHRGRVLQLACAPHLVQPEPDQGFLLAGLAAGRRGSLCHAHLTHLRAPPTRAKQAVPSHAARTARAPSCRAASPLNAARRNAGTPQRPPSPCYADCGCPGISPPRRPCRAFRRRRARGRRR